MSINGLEFDSGPYVSIPRLTLAAVITLARELLESGKALPADAAKTVAKARQRLEVVVAMAAAAYQMRQREQGYPAADERHVDRDADLAWSGLRARLSAYADLPVSEYPRAARAAELVGALFPSGLTFLLATYVEQNTHMAALLQRIDQERLAKDVAALAGPEFLERVRAVQPRYEEMVRAMLNRQGLSGNLEEHRRALTRQITSYATKVCATVEDDEPATAAVARVALRPLENIRGRQSSTSRDAAASADKRPEADKSPDADADVD